MIEPQRRTPLVGDEPIIGIADTSVTDFWRFALSNLQVNIVRGWFAEFLVAKALGIENPIRVEWDSYDVEWNGIRIEVKSSGYLQAWAQRQPSALNFSGLTARPFEGDSTEYAAERSYNADVYVFAIQMAQTHDLYDQLDVDQWRFAVLPVSEVEATGYRSLSWTTVIRLAGAEIGFDDLREEILRRAP